MLLEVADQRIGGEDLLPGRHEGDGRVEGQGDQGDPHPLRIPLAHDHDGDHQQGHGGDELVGDAEQRIEGLDAAARVGHAHEQQ